MQNNRNQLLKPLMIFLPGKLCDKRVWEVQMEALSQAVRPICLDLRYSNTLEDMFQLILDVANGENFILAGFSLGGYVAQEFILKYPDKVTGLVLVACSARGLTKEERHEYSMLMQAVIDKEITVMTGYALRAYLYPPHYEDKKLVQFIEGMVNDAGDEVFLRQQKATLNRERRFEDLAKTVCCPAIVIGGAEDKIVAIADVEATANAIHNAEYHSIPECGHMIALEQTNALNILLLNWVKHNFY